MRKMISIIGDSKIEKDGKKYRLAFSMGKALVDNGYRVASGGLGGVMEAAFEGARSSEFYREGDTVAILPMFDRKLASDAADIVIATGLDVYRNVIVANSDAVIAIGGGAGTLAEMSNAWPLTAAWRVGARKWRTPASTTETAIPTSKRTECSAWKARTKRSPCWKNISTSTPAPTRG